ncbi:MAG: DUF4920 domain-containing protein [Chitinophagaceae bacterium]|nr:DUF4920 domain-containing protein [Chitinophagaceae bacterium]MCW5905137.1 DUF4920 domain-containing protein [Chitinophagaceae bacterium]
MKRIFLLGAVLFAFTTLKAQPPKGNADKGDVYGQKFDYTDVVDIATLPKTLESVDSINGTFRAKIVEVCPKKGCWLRLFIDENTTAFVKMKDYAFFLPVAAEGKTVILHAEAKLKVTSVKELKHYAEDAKKSKEEIDAITKPEKEIRLLASGIVVVE